MLFDLDEGVDDVPQARAASKVAKSKPGHSPAKASSAEGEDDSADHAKPGGQGRARVRVRVRVWVSVSQVMFRATHTFPH